jgi:hypothetical protein
MVTLIPPTVIAEKTKKFDIGECYIQVRAISSVLQICSGYYESEWEKHENTDVFIDNVPSVTMLLRKMTYNQLDVALETLKTGKDFTEFMNAVKNGDIK